MNADFVQAALKEVPTYLFVCNFHSLTGKQKFSQQIFLFRENFLFYYWIWKFCVYIFSTSSLVIFFPEKLFLDQRIGEILEEFVFVVYIQLTNFATYWKIPLW
jgi:hypothetical protein